MKKTKGGLLWPSLQRFCGLLWQLSLLKFSEARAPGILLFSPFTYRTQFLFRGTLGIRFGMLALRVSAELSSWEMYSVKLPQCLDPGAQVYLSGMLPVSEV